MVSKNNVIVEIQELIQQIKTEYQEGVDFRFSSGKNALKNHGVAFIVIISPRLKKFFRERFNFPLGAVNHLDYVKMDHEGGDLLYRIHNHYEDDVLSSTDGRVWPEKEKGESCQVCGNLTFKKNGRMELWNGEKTDNRPAPKVISYFHPECAKKYFAGKEQPNKNNTRIKEKLLRNLDKLCLDPDGYLANNEYLKTDKAEEEYNKLFNSGWEGQKGWKNRYLKIIIDGEEIDLEDWDNSCPEYYEVKRELIKKIKQEIQQNPSEWKIERGKEENYSWDANWLVKHQKSGRRHWKIGLCGMHGKKEYSEEGKNYWAEIEALINGSPLPVKNQNPTATELNNLKIIFQKLNIKKITFVNGKLTIEFNNQQTNSVATTTNNQEYQAIKKYCQEHNKQELTSQELNITSANTSTNSNPNQNNHQLLIGLALGAGLVILIGILVYFGLYFGRNKKKIN